MKKSIKYSHKHFSDYLENENGSTRFLQPTDNEVANIISSLNSNEASGPNGISYRILFLLKNEILNQLTDLFNLSFKSDVFPSVSKIAKVAPIFKKESKLDESNYCPISLLSSIEKIPEKRMYIRLFTFLNDNSIIYNLSLYSGNNILHPIP